MEMLHITNVPYITLKGFVCSDDHLEFLTEKQKQNVLTHALIKIFFFRLLFITEVTEPFESKPNCNILWVAQNICLWDQSEICIGCHSSTLFNMGTNGNELMIRLFSENLQTGLY